MTPTDDFMSHGQCFLWKPELVWLHTVSDSLIALSYYSIPLALGYFVYKRRDVPFNWMFLMFGAFILACGTTHVMGIWTIWNADYWLDGAVKAATAGISLVTAGLLWPLLPKALALQSPAQLEAVNQELKKEIIERKNAEEKFRLVVEAAPTGMVMVNRAGLILLVNAQIEKLFGHERAALVGQPIEILVPERFRGQHPGHRHGFFAAPTPRAMGVGRDLYGLRKDGSEFPVEIGLNPIETDPGTVVMASIIDITERKQAEEKIRQLNEDLEQRVTELQRMVNMMTGREVRMSELKDALGRLRSQLTAAGLTPVADDPLGAREDA